MDAGADADDAFFHEFGAATLELRQAFARQAGLSWSRVRVLLMLRREGETRHSELRQRLGADGATVTRLVKQLESDGLLSRRPDPADNRYTLAALTQAGQAAAGQAERSHRRFQQQLLAGVTERDRKAVLRVLRQFRANAAAEGMPP
jgi:MarR family transcriptional regulator, transcriptional regulator for hemolysin